MNKPLSVLHMVDLDDDSKCGVWDGSEWVFKGDYEACFEWKEIRERAEQMTDNAFYLTVQKKKRMRMFGNV